MEEQWSCADKGVPKWSLGTREGQGCKLRLIFYLPEKVGLTFAFAHWTDLCYVSAS